MKWMQQGIALVACLALSAGVVNPATAAPPTPGDDKPQASKETEKSKANKGKDQKKAEKQGEKKEPETITRQSTPVLGVMIGKPMGVEGAEVIRVWPESPAEKAGLQKGDLIVKFKKERVKSPEALRAAVVKQAPGDRVAMVVKRDGEKKRLKARLGGADDFGPAQRRSRDIRKALKPRAWLGVRMLPDSVQGPGVTIEAVVPGSPADEAGLEAGDKILQVDKTRVEAIADLKTQVAGRSPGEVVRLVVRRDGNRQDIKVELGALAGWRGEISDLTEPQVRQLLEEFMKEAFDFPEGFGPEEEADKPKTEHKESKAKTGKADEGKATE